MIKDTIVQYVGFITNLTIEEFTPKWDQYAKRLMNKKHEPILFEQLTQSKNKFKFISLHKWPDRDFNFTFMNERKTEHFPEHNVKVVQLGGYITSPVKQKGLSEDGDSIVVAFVNHQETDIDFFRNLPFYRHLNINQAFYESCTYGYVLEFISSEKDNEELIVLLKQRPGVETGIFKECLVPHL